MPLAEIDNSVLIVVDLQETFLKSIPNAKQIVLRSKLLCDCASILGVPIIATEQNPDRFGPTVGELEPDFIVPKMSFGAFGEPKFVKQFEELERETLILVGAETHICITQTATPALDQELFVHVCVDAVGARDETRHKIGLDRLSLEGCNLTHTESVIYEWMETASHPQFKAILQLVKDAGL